MKTFRVHYEAMEPPRFMFGERHTADIAAKVPDDARKMLTERFDRLHKDCKPHITKVKVLKGS